MHFYAMLRPFSFICLSVHSGGKVLHAVTQTYSIYIYIYIYIYQVLVSLLTFIVNKYTAKRTHNFFQLVPFLILIQD